MMKKIFIYSLVLLIPLLTISQPGPDWNSRQVVTLTIDAVTPQMSLGGGWEQVNDTQYTSGSPLTVAAGDTTTLTIQGGTPLRDFLPPGYDSLFNRTTNRFEPSIVGEGWNVRLNFDAESNNQDGYFYVGLDIGSGSPIIITERIKTFPKGINTVHPFSQTDAVYNLATFVANGGQFVIIGGVGTTEVYNISIHISRASTPHGQVVLGNTPGYANVPDYLVGGDVIAVQYAFRTAGSGGTTSVQMTDGLVGWGGQTIADGDRVQTLDLSASPHTLTSEELLQPFVSSATTTTPANGLIVTLTILR